MDEQRRFVELMADIAADVRDGAPRRVPVVDEPDAILLARGLQREVDRQEVARARFAADSGAHIACAYGCSACCENVVVVYRPEAVLVADWLARPENQIARQRFLEHYPPWRETLGDNLDRFHELHASGDRDAAEAFYAGMRRHRVLCAFNHDGACEIYPVRPNVCRYTMALDTSEYCQYHADATRGPSFLGFPPMDELVERCRALLQVAHERMPGAGSAAALCKVVRDLLRAND